MPNLPWPVGRDASPIADSALAGLLAGTDLPADAAPGLQPVADVLAALRAGPAGDELSGEAAALAQFRQARVSPPVRARLRRRPTVLASLLSAKMAAAAAVAALGIGGIATAAYAGSLPAPLQRFAHDSVGAPAPKAGATAATHPGSSHSPAGPSATGPAAYGLCNAYAHAKAHGTAKQKAVAFRNLEAAAGGAGNVASYCAGVSHPGASSHAPDATPAASGESHPSSPAADASHSPAADASHSPAANSSRSPKPHPSHSPAQHTP